MDTIDEETKAYLAEQKKVEIQNLLAMAGVAGCRTKALWQSYALIDLAQKILNETLGSYASLSLQSQCHELLSKFNSLAMESEAAQRPLFHAVEDYLGLTVPINPTPVSLAEPVERKAKLMKELYSIEADLHSGADPRKIKDRAINTLIDGQDTDVQIVLKEMGI